ncbi:MAG: KAP family NTPase, partial [Candidatus Dormibacteraeota bacterium]|nr:KAP family NTPase [Candidatus Dormibacteraeota bacterium]
EDSAPVERGGSVGVSDAPEFSRSVLSARNQLATRGPVSSFDLINALLESHGEYFGGAARTFRLSPPADAQRLEVDEWLRLVARLFRSTAIRLINGRLLILGLTLADPALDKTLEPSMRTLLEQESEAERNGQSIWDLLSAEGLSFANARARASPPPVAPARDTNVDFVADQPAAQDELGRRAFVQALAIRIRRAWDKELKKTKGSRGTNFMIHIHGPWGSGKTTLINLLRKELEDPDHGEAKWVTVTFNAWQHQRIAPPWWWLMSSVYRRGLKRHPITFWVRDYLWRFRVGFSPYLVILVVAVVALSLSWVFGWLPQMFTSSLNSLGSGAKAISDIVALLSALAALVLGLSRLVTLGSANSASNFLQTARDPMAAIARHYAGLVKSLAPVAIFIDDLDRCSQTYVVQLLEGIQTLYRDAPAVYVVVADRRWLQACFEKTYGEFSKDVTEPGRALGGLFLEKTFQLSTSVPRMATAVRKAYWSRLLVGGDNQARMELEAARQQARADVAGKSEAEIEAMIRRAPSESPQVQALREAAVVRLADADVTAETEKMLANFAPLLEPNPRSMKRLVNAYGVQRDMAMYAEADIPKKELALWTIASLRWPLLTEQLEKAPALVDAIVLEMEPPRTPELEPLRVLFTDPDVRRVFGGEGIGVKLTAKTVTVLSGMRTSDSSAGGVA